MVIPNVRILVAQVAHQFKAQSLHRLIISEFLFFEAGFPSFFALGAHLLLPHERFGAHGGDLRFLFVNPRAGL